MAADAPATPLKTDLFGTVVRIDGPDGPRVARDTREARWWTRWLARRLAAREARALAAAAGVPDVPRLISWDGRILVRTWLEVHKVKGYHGFRPAGIR